MIIALFAIIALAALAFGGLGYITGRNRKPYGSKMLILVVTLMSVVAVVDLASGFKLGMFHICGPWLVGVGIGMLARQRAEARQNNNPNQ